MITIKNTQRSININKKSVQAQVQAMLDELDYSDFDIGIWFTTNKTIRQYNKDYRDKDKPTDILSFPYHTKLVAGDRIQVNDPTDKNIGDIIISCEYALADSVNWKHSFNQHLTMLLAHGIAHLLNYDHQTDEEYAVMSKVEEKLRNSARKITS